MNLFTCRNDENIEMFYFSSFDESWKVGSEGDVGAFWGLWDKDEKLKVIDGFISYVDDRMARKDPSDPIDKLYLDIGVKRNTMTSKYYYI